MLLRVHYIRRGYPAMPTYAGREQTLARADFSSVRQRLGADEMLFIAGPQYAELFLAYHDAETRGDASREQLVESERTSFEALLRDGDMSAEKRACTISTDEVREAATHFLRSAIGWMPDGQYDSTHTAAFQDAYAAAVQLGVVGTFHSRLHQLGIAFHEKVRLETAFFDHSTSTASATVEVARKIFGELKHTTALLIGANAEAVSIGHALLEAGLGRLNLSGKSSEAQKILAQQVSGPNVVAVQNGISNSKADLVLVFENHLAQLGDPKFLHKLMSRRNNAPFLLVDFTGELENAAALQKMYNVFFFEREDLTRIIEQNLHLRKEVEQQITEWLRAEVEQFFEWAGSEDRFHFGGMVGSSRQMQAIFETIARIARTDITVLIQGESGTGKELIARAVHETSGRAKKPFVVVNCGAIPENLLESELFGHVRGAFTGAISNKKGLFEEANTGTIFLDEIAELPPHLQVKLLRFLQEGEIKRVGSNSTVKLDVRVIAASNRDLQAMVSQERFRSDLFFRLNVIQITLPPLRQRTEDIPVLARHFLHKFANRMRKPATEISAPAMEKLVSYSWPGNVRELENVMERAVALSTDRRIDVLKLPDNLQQVGEKAITTNHRRTLKEIERDYIFETVAYCEGDYDEAAKALGIGRTTLWRKLKEYQEEKESNGNSQ